MCRVASVTTCDKGQHAHMPPLTGLYRRHGPGTQHTVGAFEADGRRVSCPARFEIQVKDETTHRPLGPISRSWNGTHLQGELIHRAHRLCVCVRGPMCVDGVIHLNSRDMHPTVPALALPLQFDPRFIVSLHFIVLLPHAARALRCSVMVEGSLDVPALTPQQTCLQPCTTMNPLTVMPCAYRT